jgi:hypothetical protein
MEPIENKKYCKILVSRYSPENGCNVEEHTILTVIPKAEVKKKGQVAHYFVDSLDKKTKSKYGWVKTTDPFTLEDFLSKNGGNQNEKEIEHIKIMLNSISNLEEGTPVAATYSERGLENKTMDFTVHKIFFYKKPLV